jgi:hypothetical protein
MIDPTEAPDDKVTYTDWLQARAFFPILVRRVLYGSAVERYTYSKLIGEAKKENPDVPELQRMLPRHARRGLGTMRKNSRKLGYPDLSCLVVNAITKECGSGYTNFFDAESARGKVNIGMDWATVLTNFDGFAEFEPKKKGRKIALADGEPKASRKPSEALRNIATQKMSKYFYANRSVLPVTITAKRDLIINAIIKGASVEDAFTAAINTN